MAWLRLYDDILDDPKVAMLSDRMFRTIINLWCVAKRNGGVIPFDYTQLSFLVRMPEMWMRKALPILIQRGLIDKTDKGYVPHNWNGRQYQSDSSTERVKSFRERQRNVSETSPEYRVQKTDSETELSLLRNDSPKKVSKAVNEYNKTAQTVGWRQAQRITPARKLALGARLREIGGLEGWEKALKRACDSDFLTGRTPRSNGHANWVPDIDFFLQPKSLTKLLEGAYDNRGPPQIAPVLALDSGIRAMQDEADARTREFMSQRTKKNED